MMMDAVCISPFVLKTYEMVSDPSTDTLVSWGVANNSFVVINLFRFSQELLPKYFKHNNFSSFVRQLNTYGFRKVDPDRWEFANEHFLRGQKHLLQNIVRRRNHLASGGEGRSSVQGSVSGDVELQNQVEKLRHERNAMAMDLAELKHSQMAIDEEMREMNRRLHVTEKRPRQMMAFLAKVIENPMILARMKGSGVPNQRLPDDGRSKKRRLMAAGAEREEDHKKQSASSLPYPRGGGKKDGMVIHGGDDEGEDQNDVIQLNSLEVSPISSAKSGDMAFHDMGMNNVITGSRHDHQAFWGEEEEGPVLIENIRPPTDYVFEYQGLLPGCPLTRSLSGTLVGTGFI